MSTLRFKMVEEAIKRKPCTVTAPEGRPSEYFGMKVFNKAAMKKYLSGKVYEAMEETMNNNAPFARELADAVAIGMQKWAVDNGVTHYTHWFQPLTGSTAEKHDSFLEPDGKGGAIEEFSGKQLFQQEPDASSFPSGGIRNTFEARGYSAWDATSPAFIVDSTLCIPTVFIAYTGEALDFKTPLLRSTKVLSDAASQVCRYFDSSVRKVYSYLGWEQEYFLIDESLWAARPDIMLTGRTLIGAESAKNQQLDDHYFGAIPMRVKYFMEDLEQEAWKLGIPVHTRHNEVAPNQFEVAPVYEEVNLANDHNLLLMSIIDDIAHKHGFRCLLHEKPFAGINGSGKHNNWSIGTDTGVNLLSPGKTPKENLQFVTFLVNVLMAVYKNNGLLKASISSATNAHRLGANEAPPAIISVFLGTQVSKVLDKIEANKESEIVVGGKKGYKMPGLDQIPELFIDNTDRNRTSPFAFTGNSFEFRAVGSMDNCGSAMSVLNTAVAAQLVEFKKAVDKKTAAGMDTDKAIYTVVRSYIKSCKAIRFDGNGYSDEWKTEAAKRGLDCETSVPIIFDNYLTKESEKLFTSLGVMSKKEIEARCEVKWETYTKKIQIEARLLGDIALNEILPVASRYQAMLVDKVSKMSSLFPKEKLAELDRCDLAIIESISEHVNAIREMVHDMVEARKVANKITCERTKAIAYHDTVVSYFDGIRKHIDKLEMIVDNEMWPLPKYREMLFIK